MVSAERRNAYVSHLFLNQRVHLRERLFTRVSTFDIDRSTRIAVRLWVGERASVVIH
jgi:hypothetical protein